YPIFPQVQPTGRHPLVQSDNTFVVNQGKPQPIQTLLVGGPQDGRMDSWFTLPPEYFPEAWGFPRQVQTPEGEVQGVGVYRKGPDQVPAYGGVVLYDYDHTVV